MREPKVHVGILSETKIEFIFPDTYRVNEEEVSGKQLVLFDNGKILWKNNRYDELLFEPLREETDSFELLDVTIGINFHWERKENQRFHGALKFIVEDEKITGINVIHVEDYLTSVISSEMSATASLELLKAHAVISRSWLLYQLKVESGKWKVAMQHNNAANSQLNKDSQLSTFNFQLIKWYDREDHAHFDVCADDHCQRYQGISKAYTPAVREALEATRGEVLTYEGTICDARFSKCCGGATERFDNTWEPVVHPYLDKITDAPEDLETGDLRDEQTARKWILSFPPAFCHTTDRQILSQVLNDYDQETQHFFRWQVSYPAEQLSELVYRKIGIDFGTIRDIQPIERGVSGRLIRVKITGDKKTLVIGKELIIRKAFSESHLYSSAFIVEKQDGIFTFHGAGWGHGVGLCQIGAAVMGARGYNYKAILQHYFKGCELIKMYE